MRVQTSRAALAATLLALAPAAWAHPALFDGGIIANLLHLLTQTDHLLVLAGVGIVAGIARKIWKMSS